MLSNFLKQLVTVVYSKLCGTEEEAIFRYKQMVNSLLVLAF